MNTDPLRVAGWSVVAMGVLVFSGAAWRIATSAPVAVPPPSPPPAALLATPVSVMTTTTEVTTTDSRPRGPQPSESYYVGNTNTHKFHKASCRYAGCKNCTARYATREEAIKAGYRPCGNCDP